MALPAAANWIEVTNFSAGIRATRDLTGASPHAPVVNAEPNPDGAARPEGTWGCIGHPDGGLYPAPAIAFRSYRQYAMRYGGNILRPTTAPDRVRYLDFVVIQSTFNDPYRPGGLELISNPPDMVVLLAQQVWIDNGETTYKSKVGPLVTFETTNDLAKSLKFGRSYTLAGYVFAPLHVPHPYLNDAPASLAVWGSGNIVPGRFSIDINGNYAEGDLDEYLLPGLILTFGIWGVDDAKVLAGWRGIRITHPAFGYSTISGFVDKYYWPETREGFPKPLGDGSAWLYPRMFGGAADKNVFGAVRAVWHQQRLVYTLPTEGRAYKHYHDPEELSSPNPAWGDNPVRDTYRTLMDGESLFSDERLAASSVLWHSADPDLPTLGLIADSGKPDQVGVLYSVGTTELYIVKARGGGVIVTDSIERPSVRRYPGVASTGNYPHQGTYVPGVGLVYGSNTGVHAWAGGNQSVHLSPQLPHDFWLTPESQDLPETDERREGMPQRHPFTSCGRFAFQAPFVYAPNNWVFDTRSGGWFRLCEPRTGGNGLADFAFFDASSGRLYAAPASREYLPDTSETSDEVSWVRFGDVGTDEYRWASHPLARATSGRIMDVKSVELVASGKGTVELEVTGDGEPRNGSDDNKIVFEVDNNEPKVFTGRVSYLGHQVSVNLHVRGEQDAIEETVPFVRVEPLGPHGPVYLSIFSTTDFGLSYAGALIPGAEVISAGSHEFSSSVTNATMADEPTYSVSSVAFADTSPSFDADLMDPVNHYSDSLFKMWTPTADPGVFSGGSLRIARIRFRIPDPRFSQREWDLFHKYVVVNGSRISDRATGHWWALCPAGDDIPPGGWVSCIDGHTFYMPETLSHNGPAPIVHRFSLGYDLAHSTMK